MNHRIKFFSLGKFTVVFSIVLGLPLAALQVPVDPVLYTDD